MVSFDLLEDYDAGGRLGACEGLDFVCVPLVVTEAIEEFPPLSRLTVD
jgi:hypothetical protein